MNEQIEPVEKEPVEKPKKEIGLFNLKSKVKELEDRITYIEERLIASDIIKRR